MSIWGKIAGAAAGLAVGGPIGALFGTIAGHYVFDRAETDPAKRQVAFTIGVIALGAKMAKADGVVTRDEVEAFRQIFQVPPAEVKNVARVFNLAKQSVSGFEAYAAQLAQMFGSGSKILEDVLDGLFHIAKADGVVHPKEIEFLEQVTAQFGFDAAAFGRIRARHVRPDQGDPYEVLGLGRSADNDMIKKTYRQLVRENHPDKMIARGVPQEFVTIANERLARINSAYDQISKERGI
ncbi:MAG: TerB family tellurite resistance protein [Alphaproteobacteria bacterium]